MIGFIYFLIFSSVFGLTIAFFSSDKEARPRLRALAMDEARIGAEASVKKRGPSIFKRIAVINKPLCVGPLGKRIAKDLSVGQVNISPEEFILIKELLMGFFLFMFYPKITPETTFFFVSLVFVGGYILPEFWLKSKVSKVKAAIVKQLPDTVDLLGLCVNAGLDFMLAMKWVIEKSPPTILLSEIEMVLQEINVGKPRRDALRDLAQKYQLPDLSTFSRTLIQADRMGTSIGDALNILSEDMRLARFRRGEQVALKAPLKMLVPLLFFIFPVVAILVGAPILLDFMRNNTMSSLTSGK